MCHRILSRRRKSLQVSAAGNRATRRQILLPPCHRYRIFCFSTSASASAAQHCTFHSPLTILFKLQSVKLDNAPLFIARVIQLFVRAINTLDVMHYRSIWHCNFYWQAYTELVGCRVYVDQLFTIQHKVQETGNQV